MVRATTVCSCVQASFFDQAIASLVSSRMHQHPENCAGFGCLRGWCLAPATGFLSYSASPEYDVIYLDVLYIRMWCPVLQ